ncbi:thioredoxin-like protein [Schizopora paradoxa]|uniref:Thioredoxin-like protein n=1 Tax=Schizopora paradoxa TaxID=27342 RepID=A0A0H2RZQ0_9AGAM|nr:thioredoxin-like protein [Schizopora paradoxa]
MGSDHENDSDDEIFAELEKDIDENFDMAALREQRLEELQQEMRIVKDMKDQNFGKLTEMKDEKEVLKTSASEKRCVIHFYHHDFKRCQIMNDSLAAIAPKYFNTRFLRVFVENVPWLVEKLQIKILPCVICFIDGVAKDRLIGFEALGNSETFEIAALELQLQTIGVIDKPGFTSTVPRHQTKVPSRGIRSGTLADEEDSDCD